MKPITTRIIEFTRDLLGKEPTNEGLSVILDDAPGPLTGEQMVGMSHTKRVKYAQSITTDYYKWNAKNRTSHVFMTPDLEYFEVSTDAIGDDETKCIFYLSFGKGETCNHLDNRKYMKALYIFRLIERLEEAYLYADIKRVKYSKEKLSEETIRRYARLVFPTVWEGLKKEGLLQEFLGEEVSTDYNDIYFDIHRTY